MRTFIIYVGKILEWSSQGSAGLPMNARTASHKPPKLHLKYLRKGYSLCNQYLFIEFTSVDI